MAHIITTNANSAESDLKSKKNPYSTFDATNMFFRVIVVGACK